ncbi:hypothetical protein ABZX56_30510 [Streptomyces parvulus]|uniref:hypothetical protein n=1 Tax=Streptomyces TaxID=1883 RepID=UPI0033A0E461
MLDPTRPKPPAWATEIAIGLHALKHAAERARIAYQSALAATDSLNGEVAAAEQALNGYTTSMDAPLVTHDGYAHHPVTELQRSLALAHSELAWHLARIYRRTAYAYAYGCSALVVDLPEHGLRTRITSSHTDTIPRPHDHQLAALYWQARTADEATKPLGPGARSTRAWAHAGASWEGYAKATEAAFYEELTSAHLVAGDR